MFSLFEFDQYEIGELIDEGIVSKVFKAIDKKTGKEVAIKTGYYYYENILANYEQMRFLNSISLYNHNLPGIVNLINFRFPLANEEKTKLNPFFYNHEGRKKKYFLKALF